MQNSGSKKNWQLYALSLAMPEVKKKRKEKEKRKGKTQQICKFNKTFESFCADKYSILNFFDSSLDYLERNRKKMHTLHKKFVKILHTIPYH